MAQIFAATQGQVGVAQPSIGREGLTVNFGDFQSHAELDYPAGATGKLPAVVLIPGSSPEDLNANISTGPGQPVLSHIFLDIANYLSPRGFAVMRYNKHYVTSATQVDYQSFYTKLTLQQMLKDADDVLRAAEADPHVDTNHVFLYGWSEGSTVAAALAVEHPELAGLIVQGPVAEPWKDLFLYQIDNVGLPYLRQVAPDGRVTDATLKALFAGHGGLVAKGIFSYLADFTQTTKLAINPLLDRNHDGAIEIDTEFVLSIGAALDALLGPKGPLGV